MRIFLVLSILTIFSSCKKDIAVYDCKDLVNKCQGSTAADTSSAYLKIIGTWTWEGYTYTSWTDATPKTMCDKSKTITLVFDSNRQVSQYTNGKLDGSSSYKIYSPVGLNLSCKFTYGRLIVCDEYLTIIRSDVDGSDNYYTKAK